PPSLPTLSLHDALPISGGPERLHRARRPRLLEPGMSRRRRKGPATGRRKASPVDRGFRFVDNRLGISRFTRKALTKIFPDHWSRSEEHTSELQSQSNLV